MLIHRSKHVRLFRRPEEWSNWAGFYTSQTWNKKDFEEAGRLLPRECLNLDGKDDRHFRSCYDRLAQGRKRHQAITTILPMVTVKAYTPFDLVKVSGGTILGQPPGGQIACPH